MTTTFNLLEEFQLNSHIYNGLFACEYSEDGRIFILADAGIYILTLKGYMDSTFPRFSFAKELMTLKDTSICQYVELQLDTFLMDLSRNNFYESVLDASLSGNGLSTEKLIAKPLYAMWSPRGIIEKTDCVLAVLTSLHNIEIYVRALDENGMVEHVCVANFARDISDHYRKLWKTIDSYSAETKLQELKRRVDQISPTTFTWSHVVLKDRRACCILFVGHRDGSVSAWRFGERKVNESHESKLEFLDRYDTKVGHITALHWFCRRSDGGGLSIGDSEGRVCALSVSKLSTDKIKFSDEVIFCPDCDLKVDHITIMSHQNITYMVVVKRGYLLVYGIDEYGEVFQGRIVQGSNLYVTGIHHFEKNMLMVLSSCGKLTQFELKVDNSNLIITEHPIPLDELSSDKYGTHGLILSPNKVFVGVLGYPSKVRLGKSKESVSFFIYENCQKDPFQLLINISSHSLRDHWDCLETLRVRCFQQKKFPWEGIDPNLNYDTLSLLKLKILRWLAKISESVYDMVPRLESYDIKPYALLNYAVDMKLAVARMNKLLSIYFTEKKLTLFQMQSLDLLNFFLKEMVAMDVLTKANLGNTFIDEIYEVIRVANELRYPPAPQCIWCGESVIGISCVPYHMDSRCSISLMPIKITPGYKCPFCKCVVSKELDKEYYPIFCPYCDIPMERRYVDRRSKKDASESSKVITMDTVITSLTEVVKSDCYSDCLKDEINLTDIEDNAADYVVLTDSEDEKETLILREKYMAIREVVLAVPEEEAKESESNVDAQLHFEQLLSGDSVQTGSGDVNDEFNFEDELNFSKIQICDDEVNESEGMEILGL